MTGPHAVWVHFLGEILGLMVQQKRLLISDKNVLSSLFSSLLGNSNDSLLVQHNVGKRFALCSNSTHLFLVNVAFFAPYLFLVSCDLRLGSGLA